MLTDAVRALSQLQARLYAENSWSVLLIFQAMDAAGKDSTIKHVFTGVNPAGIQVTSFKSPSAEELDHDYLWRCVRALPERGRIGIFNRSYYEETLVVRVHPELLAAQRIPAALVGRTIWTDRFEDIRGFERHLARNGCIVLKFFLYVSRAEQRRRFLARLDEPEKNWKFSTADVRERSKWGAYMKAYEDAIRSTASDHAPWYVVPSDHKWFQRLVVAEAIVDALRRVGPRFPRLDSGQRKEQDRARALLLAEGGGSKKERG